MIKALFLLLLAVAGWSCSPPPGNPQPTPSDPPQEAPRAFSNVSYGPDQRNVFDIWLPQSEGPTPLLLFFHGGGFEAGDKSNFNPVLRAESLKAGFAFASANYRLSQTAPFPAPMEDAARVVQYLRENADEYNLDPRRFAAAGESAGGGLSLWLAFHEDLAEPDSPDPVKRHSTRLSGATVFVAQSSYDPRFMKEHVGGRAHEHPFLPRFYGLPPEEMDTEKAHRLYEEASPITHLTPDDPDVWMYFGTPDAPIPEPMEPGRGIHHPRFGRVLADRMEELGLECEVVLRQDLGSNAEASEVMARGPIRFLRSRFEVSERQRES